MNLLMPEPELVAATLAKANCRSLARIIADLLNENEPLLKAEIDGSTVIVRERGGPAEMQVTIEHQGSGVAGNRPPSDQ